MSGPGDQSASAGPWTLGLGGSTHDFSAALTHGRDIRVAIEEERVSRVKRGFAQWFDDPTAGSVRYCCEAERIERGDLAAVVTSDLLPHRVRAFYPDIPLTAYPHHLTHAASACMMLPQSLPAAVIVYDGIGSASSPPSSEPHHSQRETISFFQYIDGFLAPLGTTYGHGYREDSDYPDSFTNSIGLFYEIVSVILGFTAYDAGKVMGMSAWGQPRYVGDMLQFFGFGHEFDQALRFDPFQGFPELIRGLLRDGGHPFEARADIAASAQEVVNRFLRHCVRLVAEVEHDVLCVAGGCALNSVANGAVAAELAPGRRILIPPFPHDSGLSLGALWLHAGGRELTFRGGPLASAVSRHGRRYTAEDVRAVLPRYQSRIVHDPSVTTPEDLADLLVAGQLVGVFQGGSEFGPRALGGRSILADPRTVDVRERINRQVKRREPFRPLAPLVLADHFDDYFTPTTASNPHMSVVARATRRCAREAPAIVHIDGSARVQSVGSDSDRFLLRVLTRFHQATGVPVLLNTSLNGPGEPIVETPEQAVDCLLRLGLDGLFAEGSLVRPASPKETRS